jgi:hypothetical protein
MQPTPDDVRAVRREDAQRFRKTLFRVMAVQLVALILLGLLQARFTR